MSISQILSVRKQRLSLQREADLLEQKEKALQNDLINEMVSHNINLFKDGEDEVTLVTTVEPVATSWPALLDYIRKNDALDLFQKRLTASAVKLRWADGEAIPGVDKTDKHTLKFNI
jgi:hypothetical protein